MSHLCLQTETEPLVDAHFISNHDTLFLRVLQASNCKFTYMYKIQLNWSVKKRQLN